MGIKYEFFTTEEMACFLKAHVRQVHDMHAHAEHVHAAHAYAV
jgi:hypothetical protein